MEGRKISIFDAFVFAFRTTVDHIRLFVMVLLLGIALAIGAASLAALFNIDLIKDFRLVYPHLQQLQASIWIGPLRITTIRSLIPLISSHLITLLIAAILFGLIFCSFDLGVRKIGLDLYDTDRSSAKVAFSYFYLAPRIMFAWLLYAIIVSIGLVLLIVPGLYWFLRFGFFPYFILEKNRSIIDSFRSSFELTEGYVWDLFVLWIITRFILHLGIMVWCGFFVTWPIALLSHVYVYRRLMA
ncbi:MAG: YciC family protein [Candidatus Babeliales bacterium]|jgi:Uncharacterised protein family (UPF0259)